MLSPLIRAGVAAALLCCAVHCRLRQCRRQAIPEQRSRRAPSRSRRRSSPMPARRPSRWRKSAATPTRPLPRTISAPAWRCSARSSPRRRTTAPPGCGWRAPSCRSGRRTTTRSAQLLERASTAAYIAYQRTGNRNEEADSLVLLGNVLAQRQMWRPALDALRLSLELREAANVRAQYERMREEHGFRVLDYTVDADTASPRACFQFSEGLAGADRFLAVRRAGRHRQAGAVGRGQAALRRRLAARPELHVTLRAGLPSIVHETLSKSARLHHLCARPQARRCISPPPPMCCRAPGQRGIPVISVNTARGRGRDLPHQRPRSGRRHRRRRATATAISRKALTATTSSSCSSRAALRCGRASSPSTPRRSTPKSPPRFRSTRRSASCKPGVYVMVAQPKELKNLDNNYDSLATQWFIVSDLGLTAFSGNDGIHVFVNSLATTEAEERHRGAAGLAQQRGAGDAPHRCRRPGAVRGRAWPAGRAARRPRWSRHRRAGRLCLPQPHRAGLRSHRPRRRRPSGAERARCFRLCRARRLSLRRDRLRHGAVARCRRARPRSACR